MAKTVRVVATAILLTLTLGPALYFQINAEIAPTKIKVDPPKLPPVWEIYKVKNKEAFQSTLDEASNLGGLTVAPMHTEQTERSLRGFRGYYYTDLVNGNQAVILNESLNISKNGNWTVEGLVRNETTENIGTIMVTAELISKTDAVLETLSNKALVQNIRPGEPSPFKLDSSTPASEVKEVKWIIRTEKSGVDISREARIMTDYELEFGSNTYRGHKRDDAPYPYVLAAAFDNLGRALKSAKVVVAWIDETGKVTQIKTSQLDDGFKNGVPESGAASFKNIIVSDPAIGPELSKNPYTMWVMGE